MGKNLVIVESPAKTKTLKKFLGKDYQLESSLGHIKNLPQKSLGVKIEEDFKKLPAILAEIETLQDEEPPSPQAQQLSMF